MNLKKIRIMIVAVVSLAFVMVCLTSGAYANTATQKQPLKIVWKNKNITEKLNPALSKGEIYVIDSNFMQVVRGYERVAPLFKKNNKGQWKQYALSFGIKNGTKHELIMDTRFYEGTNNIRMNDLSGFRTFHLQVIPKIAKMKSGEVYYISEQAKWVDQQTGKRYVADRVVKTVQSEYGLHYVPMVDLCKAFNLKLVFNQASNTYTID